MPVRRGTDSDGPFFQWGRGGRKYRYRKGNDRSRDRARARAVLQGRAAQSKAPKSGTPARGSERRRGSRRNKPGTASGTRGGIRISEATTKTLRDKVAAHNEEHGAKSKRADLGMLKAVYRRGAGAFSSSHSPRVKSRDQWAIARVNAFLRILATGKPRNAKYTGDNDLLPAGHPRSTRKRRGS
jgi:hypothetical protein